MSHTTLISTLLPPRAVVLDTPDLHYQALFDHLGQLFAEHYGISATSASKVLRDREQMSSTAIGHGVAIPHGRLHGLHQPLGLFLRLATALDDCNAPDQMPVRLIFSLLIPEKATAQHLEILAELMQTFSLQEKRTALLQATSASEVCALFANNN